MPNIKYLDKVFLAQTTEEFAKKIRNGDIALQHDKEHNDKYFEIVFKAYLDKMKKEYHKDFIKYFRRDFKHNNDNYYKFYNSWTPNKLKLAGFLGIGVPAAAAAAILIQQGVTEMVQGQNVDTLFDANLAGTDPILIAAVAVCVMSICVMSYVVSQKTAPKEVVQSSIQAAHDAAKEMVSLRAERDKSENEKKAKEVKNTELSKVISDGDKDTIGRHRIHVDNVLKKHENNISQDVHEKIETLQKNHKKLKEKYGEIKKNVQSKQHI